jgi:broad specificity phosphatase PhoE
VHRVLYDIAEQHAGETVLAISHGGIMRVTLPLILTAEPAHPPAELGNCAVVELTSDGRHWTCVSWPTASD